MKAGKINYQIILGLFIALTCCLLIPQTMVGQTEKLGIVSYTAPNGWAKTSKAENVVAFSEINQTTGGFGIITLYGAAASTGNPTGDFTREWNNLAVKTLKAPPNPQTETQAASGWTIISGAAGIEIEGSKALTFLTVYSGFGKTVSVLAVFNNQSYMTQLEAFIGSLKLAKSAAPTTDPVIVPNNQPASQNNSPGKFGLMGYTSPAGWNEQQFPDGVVFKPVDLPAGEHLAIQIMPPSSTAGTLEQVLQQSYDEAAAMYKATKMYQAGGNYSKNAVQRSFNGWEYIRGKGSVKVQDGTQFGTEYGLELFVIHINNRFERVAIFESRPSCKTYSQRYYSSDRVSYRNGIESLLFSFQFSDFTNAGLKTGSTKGTGVVGVWQGTMQSTSATGLKLEVDSVVFLTNGQVYFGPHFPTEGFDELNTRLPPERNPRDWATYTFSNGRGVLKMPYAELPFRIEGSKLIITKNQTDWSFFKLNPVDGALFNGTYTLNTVNGITPTITFTADGRFTDNGALKTLYHEYIDCLNPATAPGSGTYRVKDHSVIFTYADGRKIKLAFLGIDYTVGTSNPPVLRMSYDDNKLTRQ